MGKNEFKGIIKSIEITQFRKMKDISFKLAPHVTIIAGKNATMKSTLLGMLVQPFSFRAKPIKEGEEDTNPPIIKERTLTGHIFGGKFSDKFRLSKNGANKVCIDLIMGHASRVVGERIYTHKTIEELKQNIELVTN